MALISSYTRDREVSVGSTAAVIDMTSGLGCTYDESDEFGGPFKYRIKYSVNSDLSSPSYTTAVDMYSYGIVFDYPFAQDITISGLTANTTYYYIVQVSMNGGSTYIDALNYPAVKGTFTTTASTNPPAADFTVSTTTGKIPLTVILTGSNTGGALSDWKLAWGDGAFTYATQYQTPGAAWTQTSKFHSYVAIGTYTVTATLTNADGADTETKTNYIHAAACVVTATFTVATTDPHSGIVTVTLTDSSTTDDVLGLGSRLWTVTKATATQTSTQNPYQIQIAKNATNAGYWAVSLAETTPSGATSAVTNTSAFLIPYADIVVAFSGVPLQGVSPLSVNFQNSSTADGMQAGWMFGDGGTSTSTTSVTHTYTTTGAFDVTLWITGSSTSTTGTAATSLTKTSYINVWDNSFTQNLGGLFRDVQSTLMSQPNDLLPCAAFAEFGGLDNLVTIYYRRLREFLRETELTQSETTLSADTAGVYALPTNLVKLIRVEVDGQNVNPMDRKQADLQYLGWATTTSTGEVSGYIYEPEDALTLRLVPKLTGRTIKVLYVAAPDTPSIPNDCLTWPILPLPYCVSWVVKWGMIADLLRQEGELNDPIRAAFAEEIYQLGVQLTKLLLYPRTR